MERRSIYQFGRSLNPPPFTSEGEASRSNIEDDYEKILKAQLVNLERGQKAQTVELILIAKQKQNIQACMEAIKQKKEGVTT